jgi:tetratricopeptide (TPR) repeat protein
MTPHTSTDPSLPLAAAPSDPAAAQGDVWSVRAASAGPGRRRWLALAAGAILLAGIAAAAWWRLHPPPISPPMPNDIEDAEVGQAVEQARRQVIDNPDSAGAWGGLGMVLVANLLDRDADRCFLEAIRLAPSSPKWRYARAIIAVKRGNADAISLLREAEAVAGSWPEYRSVVRLQLGEALLENRQLEEAERWFRAEWQATPNNPRAALGLGMIALARDEEAIARDFLSVARKSPLARKKATVQLAVLARISGDAAADDYEREISTLTDDPPWPDPLLDETVRLRVGRRGQERKIAQLERYQPDEAARLYAKLLADQPTSANYVGAGLNLARLKKYEEALPLLREGVRLDPGSSRAHYTLALVAFSRSERARSEGRDGPEIREGFHEAITHARKAAELRPNYSRSYLFWGLALKHLGKPAEAVPPLRQGVACSPNELELQLALGEALLESGQLREAETYLENARKLNPNEPRVEKALERLRQKSREPGKGASPPSPGMTPRELESGKPP